VDGILTNKLAYHFLLRHGPQVLWDKILWNSYIPPSRAFITWRLLLNKLPTDEHLRTRGCVIVSICCFCRQHDESSPHIFLRCPIIVQLWDWLQKGADVSLLLHFISCYEH
jgi:hypothetical protein